MFTDMVGYTAAAQADEKTALALRREQEDLLLPVVAEHHGRKVKSTGDGFLIEFESALQATECAVEIQRCLHERNATSGVPSIRLRIGIHLGDIERQGADIFGDAVNLASRIEPIAEPGGICLSSAVQEQVRNKVPQPLEKLPPTPLKGVKVPIDLYRVVLPWADRAPVPEVLEPTGIAVLPFSNISPDPKDEYIADGLTEELITVLSQLRGLRVIARTSTMLYKSSPKGVSQIAAELGVSTVLEGSVRRAGNRLRITAQMIDARTQGHVWATTYDRQLDDVLTIQAEIARQVAGALQVRLTGTEESRLGARPPLRPESYLAYLKGRTLVHDPSPASVEEAKRQFERAISLDAHNAAAYAGLADATSMAGWSFTDENREAWGATGRRLAGKAIELDPNLAEAHAALALIEWQDFHYALAVREFELALSLNPSYSWAHMGYGVCLEDLGRADEALLHLRLAEAADPFWPFALYHLAVLLVWRGRFEEAFERVEKLRAVDAAGDWYLPALYQYRIARSEVPEALEALKRWVEQETVPRYVALRQARYSALSGDRVHARELLRQEDSLPEFPPGQYDVAREYAELGELDECFRWLEKAYRNRNLPLQAFLLDPRFQNVRADSRFAALVKRMNLS